MLKKCCSEHGWKHVEIISEVASGVNEKQRGLRKLLNAAKNGKVERIVVEYPDRLARFGYEYLSFFFQSFGVDLRVVNGNEDKDDITKELAEDLVAIVASFAARIYGRTSHKNGKDSNNTGKA